jgi:hypothetical protein
VRKIMKTITKEVIEKEYPENEVTGKRFDEQVEIISVDGFQMIDCTFTHSGHGDVLYMKNCTNCTLNGCKFTGKHEKGNFIHLQGEGTSSNNIEDCTFMNHTYSGTNGGEAIIIGLDKYTGCIFNTNVTGCTFENCNGDKELISIKSCGNVIESNTFKNWTKGNVSIRNGGFNQILSNTFSGSGGGITVRGDGNEIIDNTHENNHSTDVDLRPLVIENGNTPVDENFGSDGQPHGDMKKDTSMYAQARNNTIDGNTYKNCRGVCVVWGQESRNLHPINNTFANNNLIADGADSTFLKFLDAGSEEDRKTNTFENNEIEGKHAQHGDLPQEVLIGSEGSQETK